MIAKAAKDKIKAAIAQMDEDYESGSSTSAPVSLSTPQTAKLANLFRDVDE